MLSADATSITVAINPTSEANGAAVTRHTLYIDGGSLGSAFTPVAGYDGQASTFTISTGLTAGTWYRFVTTATNIYGESAQSQETRGAPGAKPGKPALLQRGSTSTRTQLAIKWAVEPDTALPISGYSLECDNGSGDGTFTEIWNGRDRPDVLTHSIMATTGVKYSFRHKAINANGESVYSDVF